MFFSKLVYLSQIKVLKKVLERSALYRSCLSLEDIYRYQVGKFNQIWKDAYENVEFYSGWKAQNKLPDAISDLKELSQWPIITKKDLQLNKKLLIRKNGPKPTGMVKTGGSTGEPMCLPVWADIETSPSLFIGHAGLDYYLGDRTFHMWGHRHLYGKGLVRKIAIVRQSVKDWLLNRYRFPSYDLSAEKMRYAFDEFIKFKPEVFSGFSAAVLAFCRVNREAGNDGRGMVRLVLCTAGPLSNGEKAEIEAFFGASVAMEYGSADCSAMAYTDKYSKTYRTFWETHILQGLQRESGEVSNIVTRLVSCYVPIIRYDIGDFLDVDSDAELSSLLTLKAVKGRPSDIVTLSNGCSFFGAIVGDCVKQVPSVISSQLYVDGDRLEIRVVATKAISNQEKDLISLRFRDVVGGISVSMISVVQTDDLYKTVAGKIPLVVRK